MSGCGCKDKSNCGCDSADNNCLRQPSGDAGSWARLLRLRLCEPFCLNGGCLPAGTFGIPGFDPNSPRGSCPPGYYRDSATGACMPATRSGIERMDISDLLVELVKRGQLEPCDTGEGWGVRLPTEIDAAGKPMAPYVCVAPEQCKPDLCAEFGPHFNCERRASDFSPTDVESVMKVYAEETVSVTVPYLPVPNTTGNWYYFTLGAIGVSHRFCLESISAAQINPLTGAETPIAIINAAVAGERIACSVTSQGSYVHVGEQPAKAKPGDIEITTARCACKNLCALTPARGGEFYMFQTAAPLVIPVDGTMTATVTVRRDCWLKCVDRCVPPIGSQVVIGSGASELVMSAERDVSGNIPYL